MTDDETPNEPAEKDLPSTTGWKQLEVPYLSGPTSYNNIYIPIDEDGRVSPHYIEGMRDTLENLSTWLNTEDGYAQLLKRYELANVPIPEKLIEKTPSWRCEKCGNPTWGGWRAGPERDGYPQLAQCLQCGYVQDRPPEELTEK